MKLSSRSTFGIESGGQNLFLKWETNGSKKGVLQKVSASQKHLSLTQQHFCGLCEMKEISFKCLQHWLYQACYIQTACRPGFAFHLHTKARNRHRQSFRTDQMFSYRSWRKSRIKYFTSSLALPSTNSTHHLVCRYMALTEHILNITSTTKAFLNSTVHVLIN